MFYFIISVLYYSIIYGENLMATTMKKHTMPLRNTRFTYMLKRLLGEEKGAVAMEYIVISLVGRGGTCRYGDGLQW